MRVTKVKLYDTDMVKVERNIKRWYWRMREKINHNSKETVCVTFDYRILLQAEVVATIVSKNLTKIKIKSFQAQWYEKGRRVDVDLEHNIDFETYLLKVNIIDNENINKPKAGKSEYYDRYFK